MGLKRYAKKAVRATKRYANPITNVKRAYGNIKEAGTEQSKRLRKNIKGWGPEALKWGLTAAGAVVGGPAGAALGQAIGGAYAGRVAARKAAAKEAAAGGAEPTSYVPQLRRTARQRAAGAGNVSFTEEYEA